MTGTAQTNSQSLIVQNHFGEQNKCGIIRPTFLYICLDTRMLANIFKNIRTNFLPGLTVGLVSLPIAISLAVASDTTPVTGIITAIIAGFIGSLAGSSHYNVTGPAGALVGLLATYAHIFGMSSLPMLAILSGIIIYACYHLRIERYLMFIPGSALHGFILGIATMIIINQMNSALGLTITTKSPNLVAQAMVTLNHIPEAYAPAFILFCLFFAGLMFFALFTRRIPGSIILAPVGILIGYYTTAGVLPWHFQTLGSKYGIIDMASLSLPIFQFRFAYLIPAFSIAAISMLEILISAKIADGLTKTKHDKRKELLGLSLANILTGFVGGMPATAALARTALNIRSGCTHKVSGIISSLTVGLISFAILPYFSYLPLPVIAAILVFVSFRMLEMESFLRLYRRDKKHFVLALVVAFITVYEDPVVGILFGAVMAMLIFMEKFSRGAHEKQVLHPHEQPIKRAETMVYAIKGPLAYINAQAHSGHLGQTPTNVKTVVIDIHNVDFIDADGIEALTDSIQQLQEKHHVIILTGVTPLTELFLAETNTYRTLKHNGLVYPSLHDAYIALHSSPEKKSFNI
jgi:SulP family sulfate permease